MNEDYSRVQMDPDRQEWDADMDMKQTLITIRSKVARGEAIIADGIHAPSNDWLTVKKEAFIGRGCRMVETIQNVLNRLNLKTVMNGPCNLMQFPYVMSDGYINVRDMDEEEVSHRFRTVLDDIMKTGNAAETQKAVCASIDAVFCYSKLLLVAYTYCYVHGCTEWMVSNQTRELHRPFQPSSSLLRWVYGCAGNPYVFAIQKDVNKALRLYSVEIRSLPEDGDIGHNVKEMLKIQAGLEPVGRIEEKEIENEKETRTENESVRTSATRTNERTNERTTERTNERTNEKTNEKTIERIEEINRIDETSFRTNKTETRVNNETSFNTEFINQSSTDSINQPLDFSVDTSSTDSINQPLDYSCVNRPSTDSINTPSTKSINASSTKSITTSSTNSINTSSINSINRPSTKCINTLSTNSINTLSTPSSSSSSSARSNFPSFNPFLSPKAAVSQHLHSSHVHSLHSSHLHSLPAKEDIYFGDTEQHEKATKPWQEVHKWEKWVERCLEEAFCGTGVPEHVQEELRSLRWRIRATGEPGQESLVEKVCEQVHRVAIEVMQAARDPGHAILVQEALFGMRACYVQRATGEPYRESYGEEYRGMYYENSRDAKKFRDSKFVESPGLVLELFNTVLAEGISRVARYMCREDSPGARERLQRAFGEFCGACIRVERVARQDRWLDFGPLLQAVATGHSRFLACAGHRGVRHGDVYRAHAAQLALYAEACRGLYRGAAVGSGEKVFSREQFFAHFRECADSIVPWLLVARLRETHRAAREMLPGGGGELLDVLRYCDGALAVEVQRVAGQAAVESTGASTGESTRESTGAPGGTGRPLLGLAGCYSHCCRRLLHGLRGSPMDPGLLHRARGLVESLNSQFLHLLHFLATGHPGYPCVLHREEAVPLGYRALHRAYVRQMDEFFKMQKEETDPKLLESGLIRQREITLKKNEILRDCGEQEGSKEKEMMKREEEIEKKEKKAEMKEKEIEKREDEIERKKEEIEKKEEMMQQKQAEINQKELKQELMQEELAAQLKQAEFNQEQLQKVLQIKQAQLHEELQSQLQKELQIKQTQLQEQLQKELQIKQTQLQEQLQKELQIKQSQLQIKQSDLNAKLMQAELKQKDLTLQIQNQLKQFDAELEAERKRQEILRSQAIEQERLRYQKLEEELVARKLEDELRVKKFDEMKKEQLERQMQDQYKVKQLEAEIQKQKELRVKDVEEEKEKEEKLRLKMIELEKEKQEKLRAKMIKEEREKQESLIAKMIEAERQKQESLKAQIIKEEKEKQEKLRAKIIKEEREKQESLMANVIEAERQKQEELLMQLGEEKLKHEQYRIQQLEEEREKQEKLRIQQLEKEREKQEKLRIQQLEEERKKQEQLRVKVIEEERQQEQLRAKMM